MSLEAEHACFVAWIVSFSIQLIIRIYLCMIVDLQPLSVWCCFCASIYRGLELGVTSIPTLITLCMYLLLSTMTAISQLEVSSSRQARIPTNTRISSWANKFANALPGQPPVVVEGVRGTFTLESGVTRALPIFIPTLMSSTWIVESL